MGRSSVDVTVSPSVLKWARRSIGEDRAEAARRIEIDEKTLEEWEEGKVEPSIRWAKLKTLRDFYKRPLAVFLLPEPPEEPPLPTDYRTVYGDEVLSLPRKFRLAIREARWLQSVAFELAEDLEKPNVLQIGEANTSDNIEELSRKERKRIGISVNEQSSWGGESKALREWKKAVEALGVLVFQSNLTIVDKETKKVTTKIKGFSLADSLPYVIQLNSEDTPHPRIFSLFHEYAHLMLHKSGMCDMKWTNSDYIEIFCNAFAGSFLVPIKELLEHKIVQEHRKTPVWKENELRKLSSYFRVSREVILRRLLKLELTNSDFYGAWRKKNAKRVRRKKGDGGPPHEVQAVSSRGFTLTSFILEANNKGLITDLQTAEYFNKPVEYIPLIQAELNRQIG